MFVVPRLRGRLCSLYCVRRYGDKIFDRAPGCAVRRACHTGEFLVSGGAVALAGRSVSTGCIFCSFPSRAVALWGHAALAVLGKFLVSGGAAVLAGRSVSAGYLSRSFPGRAVVLGLGAIFGRSQAARPHSLIALRPPHRAISCLWEVLGRLCGALASPLAGSFCWGGGGGASPSFFVFKRGSIHRRSWRAGAPWFLVSAWGRACTFARFSGCVPSGARPGTLNKKTPLGR